jgi:hypothetical protein
MKLLLVIYSFTSSRNFTLVRKGKKLSFRLNTYFLKQQKLFKLMQKGKKLRFCCIIISQAADPAETEIKI